MYLKRNIAPFVREMCRQFPVVVITGPRQSGKTTLAKNLFKRYTYRSLESLDIRELAEHDPRHFLAGLGSRAVIDEVQRVPHLLSYIQDVVDSDKRPGSFILTGSSNLLLLQSVTQSLAGRAAFITLLPFERSELPKSHKRSADLWQTVWTGGYPAIFDTQATPFRWHENYITSYVERDVRQVEKVTDLLAFQTFLGLCAGRVGQVLNLSSLASDCGIAHATAKAWLSVLEATYITTRLPTFHANPSRRLIKAPKLHFYDSGLVCRLLKIRSAEQLETHPLRGNIFESWVFSEILKSRLNKGFNDGLHYYRDSRGLEVDLVIDMGTSLYAVEAKSGMTLAGDCFKSLELFDSLVQSSGRYRDLDCFLVYGGSRKQNRSAGHAVPWKSVGSQKWF